MMKELAFCLNPTYKQLFKNYMERHMDPIPELKAFNFEVRHKPLKRIFDLIFSMHLLLLISPFLILIAIAIKLSSQGPVFFVHKRVGRGGKLFNCYKFRTMYSDAEKRRIDMLENCKMMREEWSKHRKLKRDPRITPLGKFLRKTSLDELPQFLNVLKGDLSVVGPRPVVVDEIIEYFGVRAEKILSVRPGITGLWQVSGRSDVSYSARLLFDEKYVDEHSLLMDIKLIAKTVPRMLFSSGAY
jgi:undecaprenyl-phosphate galactose phosphotransferase